MSTSTKEIERRYEVALRPLDGPADGGTYEPVTVRLRYTPEQAERLEVLSERARAEALRRAVKLERRWYNTDEGTTFGGDVEFVGEALVDHMPRTRGRRR